MFRFFLITGPFICLLLGSSESTHRVESPTITQVILISVDGLRPELLQAPLIDKHPSMARLLRGPHTLEARTDPDSTVTLPNHIGMVTGRLFAGPSGHNWLGNTDPPKPGAGGTISEMHGEYVASIFDVASDREVATAVIVGKSKFILLDQSYDETNGALDTVDADNGRDKIDAFIISKEIDQITAETLKFIRDTAVKGGRSLSFVHFAEPDTAGHAGAWDFADETDYRKAVVRVDNAIGVLLSSIDADPLLRGQVAIVLTSDHGGGVPPRSHTDAKAPINFTIPFLVWMGVDQQPSDLYSINPKQRTRPNATENPLANAPQPIRNSDAGNVSLMLLGLPAIPKSTVNGAQDLLLVPKASTPVQ